MPKSSWSSGIAFSRSARLSEKAPTSSGAQSPGGDVGRVVVPGGIPQVAVGSLGVAPAGEHHPPRPAPAPPAEAKLGDLDRRGGLGVDHAPPSGRRGPPDAAGPVGRDPPRDHLGPAAPLAPRGQRLDGEPAIGSDQHRPAATVGQAGHALAEDGHGPGRRSGVARPQRAGDHQPALALAAEQRVVRGPAPLGGMGSQPSALLVAVPRLDGRVAVERGPGLRLKWTTCATLRIPGYRATFYRRSRGRRAH